LSTDKTLQDVRSWFDSPLGSYVLASEGAIIDQVLPNCFGYDLLQLSVQNKPLFSLSPILHKFAMGTRADDKNPLIGQATKLPFSNDSMDVVLLHHILDFYESPQQILREAGRISLPSGHVVIVGFNPISLWGAYQPIGKLRDTAPWFGRFIRPARIMDWLTLLDFKIDRAQYTSYGLPLEGYTGEIPDYSQGLSRNANWPFGAIYVIVASKQVGSMTPIKPRWQRERAFGRLRLVRPVVGRGVAQRNSTPDKPD
jgi:SAM-dependent methyltransferase